MDRPSASEVSPWLIEALLATFVALAIALIIATSQGGQHRPDGLAYLFAAGFGALMLLRRNHPLVVLAATILGLFAYYTCGYPAIGVAIPVVAALYSAAEAGFLQPAVVAGIVVLGVSWFFRIHDGESIPFLFGYELVSNVALIAAAIALGDNVRARRVRRAQQEQIDQLVAEQFNREADRRVHDERTSIARDLHDLVGNTMSVISVQANVAAEAIGRDDGTVTTAIEHIRAASQRTMQELRATVRVLRTPTDDRRTFISLTNMDSLIATAEAAGLTVSATVDVDVAQLSPGIDAAAYRVIQESLTNVIRHAGASQASVQVSLADGELHITVSDNGGGMTTSGIAGHGLAGMTERARILGGKLETCAADGGGFTVTATLPAKLAA